MFPGQCRGDQADHDPLVPEPVDRVQDIEQGAAQPVDAPHHDRVTALGVAHEFFHAGSVFGFLASGGHIGVDVPGLDTGTGEGIALEPVILPGGADPGVSENCQDRMRA